MDEQPRIGIVTVTFNSEFVIDEFMKCVLLQTHTNFLLFVVDNCSTDGTVRKLQHYQDERLKLVLSNKNVGVAEGNNLGVRAALSASCDFILLINNDVVFEDQLIAKLLNGISEHSCQMTTPKILYFDQPRMIWAAGGAFQRHLAFRIIHYGKDREDQGQYQKARQVTYVPTCCVLIARSVFERIGYMDHRYFVYVDDVDFMYRALRAGIKLFYLPDAALLHKVSMLTGGESTPFSSRFISRNRIFFIRKHLGFVRAVGWLVIYAAYYVLRLILRKDSWRIFKIRQNALFEGFFMVGNEDHNNLIFRSSD